MWDGTGVDDPNHCHTYDARSDYVPEILPHER